MYNDTIKVANKIISDKDLMDIFQKMDEGIKENNRISRQEIIQNEKYAREYQHWTCKNFEGSFKCNFNFYDDTRVEVDNYNSFITIFNSRLQEIKDLWIRYHYSYTIQDGNNLSYVHKSINMSIYENKMDIDINLSSEDDKMNDIFELIKTKILNSPERYDRIIKKKNSITNKIGFAQGFIPSIIICTLLAVVEPIRHIYGTTYILFPIAVLILSYILGNIIFSAKVDKLYDSITPEKKYAGYDSNKGKSIYKDDIDKFLETSEIIIGKNTDNIKNREEIDSLEKKFSKFIPIEMIVLAVLSIIMILIG